MNQPELGRKIAELRKAKGLTQEELVEKCNISVRTLQRIESGEVVPRSYTIKIIFTNLDYNVNDSSDSYNSKFSRIEFAISERLEQFYKYVLDLFNLKTNTMKKISVLSIMISVIVFAVFALTSESKAQRGINNNNSSEQPSGNMLFKNYSSKTTYSDEEELFGYNVKFECEGVFVNTELIKINKKTQEFKAGSIKGEFFKNKVEVICSKDLQNSDFIKIVANKIEQSDDKTYLIGKAKIMFNQTDTIETDEIIIFFK